MEITNVFYRLQQGYPYIQATIDGVSTRIPLEQKRLDEYGVLFLGPDMENVVPPVVLPANPEVNQGRARLLGFTRDKTVIKLYRHFAAAIHAADFKPGPISLTTI